jgi:uncharacterized protein (TIGR02757 family)
VNNETEITAARKSTGGDTWKVVDKNRLDKLYTFYNHREFVHPDPLEFLYNYQEVRDREVVALIASCLAYGRVAQILKSVSAVLERMGRSPFSFLLNASLGCLLSTFEGFKHRFTTGKELAHMLWGARRVIECYGSFYESFMAGLKDDDWTVIPALSAFVKRINVAVHGFRNTLLPAPDRGSACKRLNLFLRWMVRQDEVDPGGWSMVPPCKLIVPLDTHMHRTGLMLNLTRRKQADMRTALEVTHAFRMISPEDPVRYDFALTRLGIRDDTDLMAFVKACRMK